MWAACVGYGVFGDLPTDNPASFIGMARLPERSCPERSRRACCSRSRRSGRASLRFGRGAITGKCKQPPVVSAGWNQARKPSTTRRIDAVRISGEGMNRRGGTFDGSRAEAPPDKARDHGPNGKGMASSGSSSFGLPGYGVIRIHGWYRGAASTGVVEDACVGHNPKPFLPTVLPNDDAELFWFDRRSRSAR